jgi:predicted ATPase
MATPTLIGREREVAVLAELVREVPRRGAAMVLRGDPGVGKSSLLAVAARHAAGSGRAVLRVNGLESEATIPYSGLHRLLGPVLPGVGALPTRQRVALLSAFGLAEPAAEPYLVSYAALELIAEGAADAPVVLIADDVQWLDPPSASSLAFLARRIEYEPVVALFALREGFESPLADGSIPELVVPPLDDRHSTELLDRHAALLPEAARHQLLELAAGNPLALVELPRAWSPADSSVLTPVTLTTRLERAFVRRIEALPDDVRRAALVAAANDSDELAEVVRATEVLTGSTRGEDLLTVARDASVLFIEDAKVHFRHPLIRAACYQSALPSQRRAVHATLADVLAASAERRTWHRAAATVGPAEDIAVDLEAAATSATKRGSAHAGVVALTRAAQLSGSEAARGDG